MKQPRFLFVTLLLFATLFSESCASKPKEDNSEYQLKSAEGAPIECEEVWGYVNQWREQEYNPDFPITDVCYFAADLNCYGEIIDSPKRSKLEVPEGVRVHFVMICDSISLTHFVINPEFGLTNEIIQKIVNAASDFDGLQLDFENIPKRDRQAYIDFVKAIRKELDARGKNQMLSICVPGRTKFNPNEIIPYKEMGEICDRVFVMAYDEHWSTSEPGPIASTAWGKKVLDFAISQIPSEKIVMGIPFYGRTWTEKSLARAWYFSGIQTLLDENQITDIVYQEDIPSFTYDATVKVTGFFNDTYSLVNMCRLYTNPSNNTDAAVNKIGFWRIGFEPQDFWQWLKIK
ncbi:MAG: glycosyl hydrolase family 18 protein [Treponema sp.]|nr:glycosyl hydrolase family 18 protein [Treponema sp.]